MAIVSGLYVYPVKGLSAQPMDNVRLSRGHGFPGDREFAIARPDGDYAPDRLVGLPKKNYFMLMWDDKMAELVSRFDPASRVLELTLKDTTFRASLDTAEGREATAIFLARHLGLPDGVIPDVAKQRDRRYTDVARRGDEPMHWVSIINLRSVTDVETRTGVHIDPLRFRANIYVDEWAPYAEENLIGRTFSVGNVRLEGALITERCPAVEVNPVTALRDLALVDVLEQQRGLASMGIYARVVSGGDIHLGDPVDEAPAGSVRRVPAGTEPSHR